MQHRILSTIIAAALSIAASAQGVCTINGNIADCQLSNGQKVKKVTLTRTDEFGKSVEVATAKVKKGRYTFKHSLREGEPTMRYTITGFGQEGGISLFVEAGDVNISTAQATRPEESTVSGTPTNDTYAEYRAIYLHGEQAVAEQVATLGQSHGTEWLETAEGREAVKRVKAAEAIKTRTRALRFLIEHNASPMTPLEAELTLLPVFSAAYAEQITKAMSTTLHQHPYYHSLRNSMLATTLKVGSEAPDVTLPLMDGTTKHLTDFRGKYVILHFWESDCTEAVMSEMKSIHEVVKGSPEQFLLISIALDTDPDMWREAVARHDIQREHWLHACDGMGVASPAATRYKVESGHKIVLIEPEGLAVSLDMELDEVVMRLEQILVGDLYYLDQAK